MRGNHRERAEAGESRLGAVASRTSAGVVASVVALGWIIDAPSRTPRRTGGGVLESATSIVAVVMLFVI